MSTIRPPRRFAGWVLALVAMAGGATACTTTHLRPSLDVDGPEALVDQPIRIQLTGMAAGQPVTITATVTATDRTTWHSAATVVADAAGVVDLTTAAPESGSYQGVDGMGLFWSMNPDGGDGDTESFVPESVDGGRSYAVALSAAVDGREVASTTVRRVFAAADVTARALTLEADGVLGTLFTPPPGSPRRPGVLLLGGSEGGPGPVADAALLASHGYPALALGYFGQPGLPRILRDIPVEYFQTALRVLSMQPSVDSARVVVRGYSRGTEPAMLLAELSPESVRGVILYAPTDRVNRAYPEDGAAWTLDGKPVPAGPLPVAHVNAPVLAIAGGADLLWPSGSAAAGLKAALDAAHADVAHQLLLYPDAGHGVGSFPYTPGPISPVHPVTQQQISLGRTRESNEWARADGYPKVLAFLNELAQKP